MQNRAARHCCHCGQAGSSHMIIRVIGGYTDLQPVCSRECLDLTLHYCEGEGDRVLPWAEAYAAVGGAL